MSSCDNESEKKVPNGTRFPFQLLKIGLRRFGNLKAIGHKPLDGLLFRLRGQDFPLVLQCLGGRFTDDAPDLRIKFFPPFLVGVRICIL